MRKGVASTSARLVGGRQAKACDAARLRLQLRDRGANRVMSGDRLCRTTNKSNRISRSVCSRAFQDPLIFHSLTEGCLISNSAAVYVSPQCGDDCSGGFSFGFSCSHHRRAYYASQ